MKKFGKKKKNKGIWLLVSAAVAVLALLAFLLAGDPPTDEVENTPTEQVRTTQPAPESEATAAETEAETTEPSTRRELTVDSIEQQGAVMVVTTSYGTLKYPFAFSDLIVITPVNQAEKADLAFDALIDGTEYPLFTISFDGSEGILLGTMIVDAAQPAVAVYAQFFEADPSLDAGYVSSFYAAQEIFNDVVVSLEENQGFTPAE